MIRLNKLNLLIKLKWAVPNLHLMYKLMQQSNQLLSEQDRKISLIDVLGTLINKVGQPPGEVQDSQQMRIRKQFRGSNSFRTPKLKQ